MLAKSYNLQVCKISMKKTDIFNNVLRYIVEPVFVLECLEEREVWSNFNEQLAMRKLELEMEERQKDRECEERRRYKELE